MKDEFTKQMHEDWTVDEETDHLHQIISALNSVANHGMSIDKAIEWYGVTKEEMIKVNFDYQYYDIDFS